MRIPLRPPTTLKREDGLFTALRRSIPKPKAQEARKNAWISVDTWRILNKRVSTLKDPERDQAIILHLGRAINLIIKGDRRRQTEEAGEEIEQLMEADPPPPPQGILVPDEGVVQGCGQPRSAILSGHP